jgi:predicted tellurium resistance membrane protein TerC
VLQLGLFIGLGISLGLLSLLNLLTGLEKPLFAVDISGYHNDISAKSLITLGGGLFLIWKATREIHDKLEGGSTDEAPTAPPSFGQVLAQIVLLNLIFSIDSMITAMGMTNKLWVMLIGVSLSFTTIYIFAHRISAFVQQHPTVKMLGLAFLILIGVLLVSETLHVEIPKGYIYFGMAFALAMEFLNIRLRKKTQQVQLNWVLNDPQNPFNTPPPEQVSATRRRHFTDDPGDDPEDKGGFSAHPTSTSKSKPKAPEA